MFDAQVRDVGAEEVSGRNGAQVAVALGIKRDAGHDAHAQAHFHVRLDDVGVDGFEHDVGLDLAQLERVVDLGPAGKVVVVRDDRVTLQVVQRQVLARQKRVVRRRHHHMLPLVARDRDQILHMRHAFGGDGKVGLVVQHHLRNLRGRALLNGKAHLGVPAREFGNRLGQRIARLRVRGGDGEVALVLRGVVLAHALEGFHLFQHALD